MAASAPKIQFQRRRAACFLLLALALAAWNPSSNPFSEGFSVRYVLPAREHQWRGLHHDFKHHAGFVRNNDGGDVAASEIWVLFFSSSSSSEEKEENPSSDDDSKDAKMISKLKKDLTSLAVRTLRGFDATSKDRKAALSIINELARFNPTREPAAAYYKKNSASSSSSSSSRTTTTPTLAGKWTLIYTDAPDITSLQQNSLAELGRIGQECEPPYIRNVIEWKKPAWAANLPWSGNTSKSSPRIIQKVVTEASATPDKPTTVNLAVAGLSIESPNDDDDDNNNNDSDSSSSPSFLEEIEQQGLLPTLLKRSPRPINLQGPLRPPFGQFEILYLDDEFRMIRTGQGYVAVNRRNSAAEDDWF